MHMHDKVRIITSPNLYYMYVVNYMCCPCMVEKPYICFQFSTTSIMLPKPIRKINLICLFNCSVCVRVCELMPVDLFHICNALIIKFYPEDVMVDKYQ